jgi:hypothetical protein
MTAGRTPLPTDPVYSETGCMWRSSVYCNGFLLAVFNKRGCRCFPFDHRHASHVANMFFNAHQRSALETKDTTVYMLSLRMSCFMIIIIIIIIIKHIIL